MAQDQEEGGRVSVLRLIADDTLMISYRPRWNQITGSVDATIFLQQVIYRWIHNGQKPFYKFAAPCAHRFYRAGDSWQEELGFSRREFDSARRLVAAATKGQIDPDALVSYWYDRGRKTWYALNERLLEIKLAVIYNDNPAPGGAAAVQAQLLTGDGFSPTAAVLKWMGFDGRLTKKEQTELNLEHLTAWALWARSEGDDLKRRGKSPVGIARNNWRAGDWPSGPAPLYAPTVAADVQAADSQDDAIRRLDVSLGLMNNFGEKLFHMYENQRGYE